MAMATRWQIERPITTSSIGPDRNVYVPLRKFSANFWSFLSLLQELTSHPTMWAMVWEGRPLRDIREADVRRLIDSGLEEHLQLEYKSALYEDNDQGKREFLLDICMFANASGGILIIGVNERRDEEGRSTGAPDPEGILGLELPNPEAILSAYDARVMEAIEDRLPLESTYIDVGTGRRIIAIRVPNSSNKPHSVRHKGTHLFYVPSRTTALPSDSARDQGTGHENG
jgi:hypothetical protein